MPVLLDIADDDAVRGLEVDDGNRSTRGRRPGRAGLQGHALLRSEVAGRDEEAVQEPTRPSVAGTGPRGRLEETSRTSSRWLPRREARLPGDESADCGGRSRAENCSAKTRSALR